MQSHMVYLSLLLPNEPVHERRNGMSTLQTLHRCETRTVSIDAAPEVVLDLVADPRNLPVWAPRFARSVRRGERDGRWLIDNGQREFPIEIRIAREQGTVDLLDAADPRRGAFTRVVPNAHGSEYLFTLLFADGTPPVAIDEQMRTVEAELATVRELSESALRRGPEPGRATTTPGRAVDVQSQQSKDPTMDPRIDVITLAVADLDQALAWPRSNRSHPPTSTG
jgi:hypothetical protein